MCGADQLHRVRGNVYPPGVQHDSMTDTARVSVEVRPQLLDELQMICNHVRAIAGQPDANSGLQVLFTQLDEIRRELAGRGNHASND